MPRGRKPIPLFAVTCPTVPKPTTTTAAAPTPEACAPVHPAGLLYTMLRHGRGLSHEEAHRLSCESLHGPFLNSQPPKAA